MKLTIEKARNWYQETDAVHNFDHILRVYNMAIRLAKAEGAAFTDFLFRETS